MKNHQVEYSIKGMCACFGVSRSGYYAWLRRKPSGRSAQRQHLDERVKALFDKHKSRYGAKSIQQQIQQNDQQHYNEVVEKPESDHPIQIGQSFF